ncbi:MAG: hypothetical protein FJY97_19220 [candidate division Zixibacteria bacterium]|nr:hypothetical protein [candidate division Zixibacteria bacterium]
MRSTARTHWRRLGMGISSLFVFIGSIGTVSGQTAADSSAQDVAALRAQIGALARRVAELETARETTTPRQPADDLTKQMEDLK